MVMEPIFEVQFRPGSYGFRPGRGCKDALREVDWLIKEGYVHVVDADLKSYFDTIPHDRLMALVRDSISDGRILAGRRLSEAGHHERHGAMVADRGDTPGRGHLAAVGQSLSSPARSPDGDGRAPRWCDMPTTS